MTGLTRLLAGLLPLITLTLADGDPDFVEPVLETLGTEFYDYDAKTRFGFFTTPVTWYEANRLCPVSLGQLLEFANPKIAEFVARALAESAVGFGALWIGGKYILPNETGTDVGKWIWVNATTEIPPPANSTPKYPMDEPPFWVGNPNMTSMEPLCLGTDRRLHHYPIIVPINCLAKRPFICKVPSKDEEGIVPVKPPIDTPTKTYFPFIGHKTWAESHKECLRMGMALAKIVSEEDFRIVGHRMLRSRPIMENAWISGIFAGGKWQWMNSDPTNVLVDKSKNSSKEIYAWYRPENIINDGCLLADRHLCDRFVYVEAKCERRRNFICEKANRTEPTDVFVIVPGTNWTISTYPATWNISAADCKRCIKGGGELLQIQNVMWPLTFDWLYRIMALALGKEIRHAWIGGYLLKDNKFYWTMDYKMEPVAADLIDKLEIDNHSGIGESGIIEFCSADFTLDKFLLQYRCLNLDREGQKNFFMYGLQCDWKQHFICTGKDGGYAEIKDECKGIGYNPNNTMKTTAGEPGPGPDPGT